MRTKPSKIGCSRNEQQTKLDCITFNIDFWFGYLVFGSYVRCPVPSAQYAMLTIKQLFYAILHYYESIIINVQYIQSSELNTKDRLIKTIFWDGNPFLDTLYRCTAYNSTMYNIVLYVINMWAMLHIALTNLRTKIKLANGTFSMEIFTL